MKSVFKHFLVYVLYILGHVTWLLFMKHFYVYGSYYLYSYFMTKSGDLDSEGYVWKNAPPKYFNPSISAEQYFKWVKHHQRSVELSFAREAALKKQIENLKMSKK